jgi:hypothetical protein
MAQEPNGNGEKSTLKRLLSIAVGIIAVFFSVIAALIGLMWAGLASGQEKNAVSICENGDKINENRERIIRLELLDDLRSSGQLKLEEE